MSKVKDTLFHIACANVFPIAPLHKIYYLLTHRRDFYLKEYAALAVPGDKKLMLHYLLKYGFGYDEFFMFDIKHKDHTTFISECERWKYFKKMNTKKGNRLYRDKGATYQLFSDLYGRELVTVTTKEEFDGFLSKHPRVVYKPINTEKGQGIKIYEGSETLWDQLKDSVPFVLEEPIIQGAETAVFHPKSVNTIRLATILTGDSPENYKVHFIKPFLRIGRSGSFVDNASAGGIICGLSMDGVLFSDGKDMLGNEYKEHPDTHVVFDGCRLPNFENVLKTAETAALRYPENRYVGWDLAYTADGKWIIVEGNSFAALSVSQMLCGTGIKREVQNIVNIL